MVVQLHICKHYKIQKKVHLYRYIFYAHTVCTFTDTLTAIQRRRRIIITTVYLWHAKRGIKSEMEFCVSYRKTEADANCSEIHVYLVFLNMTKKVLYIYNIIEIKRRR